METLLAYSIPISIIIRIVALLMMLAFCIPLQVKEAQVKNGLRVLRFQLLAFGIILLITNIFSLCFLVLAYNTPQRPLNASLQILNAIAFYVLALIGHMIYRTQYTDEAKDYHAKIDKLEKKAQIKKHQQ